MDQEDILFELLQLKCSITGYGAKVYRNSVGEIHRVFGPAIEHHSGSIRWMQNNMYHRTDGPAIIDDHVPVGWYINNELLSEEEFLNHPLCTVKK